MYIVQLKLHSGYDNPEMLEALYVELLHAKGYNSVSQVVVTIDRDKRNDTHSYLSFVPAEKGPLPSQPEQHKVLSVLARELRAEIDGMGLYQAAISIIQG